MTRDGRSSRVCTRRSEPREYLALWALAALAMALAIIPVRLSAQRIKDAPITTIDSMRADGSFKTVPLRKDSPFALYANEDFACATWRSSGQLTGGTANQGGPAPFNQSSGCTNSFRFGGGIGNGWFFLENPLVGGAPPSEWRKIRAVYGNARNALGSGFTTFWHFTTSTPTHIGLGPADGQFGKSFSGVTIVFDGSCRDDILHQREGFALLAQLDCPVTWGSEGYRGKLAVPDAVWLARFNALGNSFTWDDWKIPTSQLDPTRYLGTNSFYGYMTDYYRERKLQYGLVVKGGAGLPTEQGYPLGLQFRIDGYQFSTPAIRNTQLYQLTIVNRSIDVYGTGIDYDSLYYGEGPGPVVNNNANAHYYGIDHGTYYIVRSGASGKCNGTYPRRYQGQTGGCSQTTGNSGGTGVWSSTWLKSPLGDLRNKLFTNPSSPYYNPTHPLRGDTITFNHAHYSGFGNEPLRRSARSGFGAVSNTELNFLDGRTPAEIGVGLFLSYFMPETYSGVLPDVAGAKYNKFVPSTTINPATGQLFGAWDYNHDGVPDTISVPGCGRQGCHVVFSDTNAGGYRNVYGNILNSITAGPFALKANDTTQFLMAFTWGGDTLTSKQRVAAIIDSYYHNFEAASSIALPALTPDNTFSVRSAELVDSTQGTAAESETGAEITLRLPIIKTSDDYLLRQIARVRQDSINNVGRVRLILRLNPGLLDRMTAIANDNLSYVYIFKSCNGGTSWTVTTGVSSTCIDAPATSIENRALPFSWRPVAIVSYTNGVPSTATYTEKVLAGRTYTYAFVTRSRGFRSLDIIDSALTSTGTGFFRTTTDLAFGVTSDTISSPLATSGPTVVSVYAPISNASGRSFARLDTSTLSGTATQGFVFGNISNTVTGTTRVVYANQFIVRKSVDTVTNGTTTTVSARWIIPRAVTSPTSSAITGFVAREQSFSTNNDVPIRRGSGLSSGTFRGIVGSSRVFVDTIDAIANVVGYVWVTSKGDPIYVTDNEYASNSERDQRTSALYPGFTVKSRDSSNASTGFRQEVLPSGALRDRNFLIRAPGDTLQPQAKQFAVQLQNVISGTGRTNPKRIRGGTYELIWAIDPWGPKAGNFRLDPHEQLQDSVDASLAAVKAVSTNLTITNPALGVMVGATAVRPLVLARLPFTMRYTDAEDHRTEEVRFAMLARTTFPNNTRLLGSGNDTARVSIPDDLWMPGDTLTVIQKVARDSTIVIGGLRTTVVEPETVNGIPGYRPIQVLVDSIGLDRVIISCTPGSISGGIRTNTFETTTCNPVQIRSRGATPNGGYLAVQAGWIQHIELTKTFDPRSVVALVGIPFTSGNVVTKAELQRVRVVPNPYIVRSDLDELSGRTSGARIVFTSVPEQGVLRIYSVSGQLLQELTWTPTDLVYSGNTATTGDLSYNLRTREGFDLESGLFVYVITATGPNGKNQVQRGKFVIIR